MIPDIIHHIWIGPQLPSWAADFAGTWKQHNPHHTCVLWCSHPDNAEGPWDDIRPLPRILQGDLISSLDAWCCTKTHAIYAAISDLLRLQVLEEHGGIYVDLDCLCFVPADEWTENRRFVVSEETHAANIGNFLIAAERGHSALSHAQRYIWKAVDRLWTKYHDHLSGPVAITGPWVVGTAWHNLALNGADITILPYQRFSAWHGYFKFPMEDWRTVEFPSTAYGCHAMSTDWGNRPQRKDFEPDQPFRSRWYGKPLPRKVARNRRRSMLENGLVIR